MRCRWDVNHKNNLFIGNYHTFTTHCCSFPCDAFLTSQGNNQLTLIKVSNTDHFIKYYAQLSNHNCYSIPLLARLRFSSSIFGPEACAFVVISPLGCSRSMLRSFVSSSPCTFLAHDIVLNTLLNLVTRMSRKAWLKRQ